MMRIIKDWLIGLIFLLCRLLPIQDKVVSTTMRGRKYSDNPRFILEELKKELPTLDFVWLVAEEYNVVTPNWIRKIPYNITLKTIYEISTARIVIDSHRFRSAIRKRKGQIFIETWHGGLGIKKIEGDIQRVLDTPWEVAEIKNTIKLADVFISNSDHLSNIYRRAFGYQGPIWKCGYPKNDILLQDHSEVASNVRKDLKIGQNQKILLYAPTYRDSFAWGDEQDFSVFDINYEQTKRAVQEHFGGEWVILIKWHPTMIPYIQRNNIHYDNVMDVSSYNDMQGLLCAVDFIISDYSSCIFDAALREIPCFTYAKDFEKYKGTQGTYFEMDELPFPYARSNEELINNILRYNHEEYLERWDEFKKKTGLVETGHAAKDIASKIKEFILENHVIWEK
ncbi:MAG: CDP-glycerol glycerophosphotransferase family protein [Aeriscardovia sp.]|nr:CDP-glycerol glycerophosphotransferase family protein [Aeriscardovia sp.]